MPIMVIVCLLKTNESNKKKWATEGKGVKCKLQNALKKTETE